VAEPVAASDPLDVVAPADEVPEESRGEFKESHEESSPPTSGDDAQALAPLPLPEPGAGEADASEQSLRIVDASEIVEHPEVAASEADPTTAGGTSEPSSDSTDGSGDSSSDAGGDSGGSSD
jgi:hypothetical protein